MARCSRGSRSPAAPASAGGSTARRPATASAARWRRTTRCSPTPPAGTLAACAPRPRGSGRRSPRTARSTSRSCRASPRARRVGELDVLAINLRTEIIWAASARDAARPALPLECTAFAALPGRTGGRTLIGQTWDWLVHAAETTVVLEARQDDGPDYVTVVEAGLLAKAGMNSAGVALATNALVSAADRGAPASRTTCCCARSSTPRPCRTGWARSAAARAPRRRTTCSRTPTASRSTSRPRPATTPSCSSATPRTTSSCTRTTSRTRASAAATSRWSRCPTARSGWHACAA